ncbi:hypothetical protein GCM10010329_76960 [Streptomyces spiroverticillatus]|nr:hypothetical protein GCM10010329_76960 [Streptomyces spiroverticillatus]
MSPSRSQTRSPHQAGASGVRPCPSFGRRTRQRDGVPPPFQLGKTRYGHPQPGETLSDDLTNLDIQEAFGARQDARRTAEEARHEQEEQQRQQKRALERARLETLRWACPSCKRHVYPDKPGHRRLLRVLHPQGRVAERGGVGPRS